MKRKINAIWKGDGIDGQGVLTDQSGAFNNLPYSFKTRFKNDDGQLGTNPEELIAASLAGCFNMKLSFVLNEANFNPQELNTEALLSFEDGEVTLIELKLQAKVAGITEENFIKLAKEAKKHMSNLWSFKL
jgi:osmotically inducible protein OsmC